MLGKLTICIDNAGPLPRHCIVAELLSDGLKISRSSKFLSYWLSVGLVYERKEENLGFSKRPKGPDHGLWIHDI